MFVYRTKIHMHQTDAAGIMFYGQLFSIISVALEEAFEQISLPVRDIFEEHDFLLPIVHAEADYKKPLLIGDVLEIRVTLEKTGNSSVTFNYQIFNQGQCRAASAKTVHVAVDKHTHEKMDLPAVLFERLKTLFKEDI